ncbi:MAG TPA: hypothetical protein VNH46_05990, partial [Gemmatimonadales bacterium]|nr:hypothetical protein [Gemmatimonadales bacterium]
MLKYLARIPAWVPLALIVAVTVAAAGTSLGNGFAYDDVHVLLRDDRIRDLGGILSRFGETYYPAVALGGGGRLYRPLTMAAFTLEWAAGQGHPLAFHLANLALYLLASLLVFALARRFLSPLAATLAAVLFAVDPVHVEAVANVVGQAELLVAVPLILAAILYVDGRRVGFGAGRTVAIAALYLAGCLAKENAALLPLLLLALEP